MTFFPKGLSLNPKRKLSPESVYASEANIYLLFSYPPNVIKCLFLLFTSPAHHFYFQYHILESYMFHIKVESLNYFKRKTDKAMCHPHINDNLIHHLQIMSHSGFIIATIKKQEHF